MPETDFPCRDPKPATEAPKWYEDRVRHAVNEYVLEMNLAADYIRIAARHGNDAVAGLLREYADAAHKRAHDAVLEAAEAVKQERAS